MNFHDSFFVIASHVPAVTTISSQGSPVVTWPGVGVQIKAAIQPRQISRLDEAGRVVSATRYEVFLQSDPSSLNGGAGIRQNDAIVWGSTTLVAAGDVVVECSPGTLPVWRVECHVKD